ncbi:MAG TPA: phosphatidate cytidylyltransferase, partial [Terriglobales bacterium]
MKRILTALVLIPLVLVAVFLATDWLLFALIGAVAILALSEYLQIVAAYTVAHFRLATVLITAAYFALIAAALFVRSTNAVEILLLATAAVFFFAPFVYLAVALAQVPAQSNSEDPAQKDSDMRPLLPGAAMSFFGIPYIAGSLACLGVMRSTPAGWFLVVFTCLAVWV